MTLQSLLVRNVVIVHPTTLVDRYGNVAADWTHATRRYTKGWVGRRIGDEVLGTRDASVITDLLTVPAGTVIEIGDRVEVDGVTFEVAGPPNRAWTPRGEHHVELDVRQIVG